MSSSDAATQSDARTFWDENQPGFRFTTEPVGSSEFFSAVEQHRYVAEPHIPEVVQFDRWAGRDVLEVGCGIGTDGVRFARAGARYAGVDASADAVALAQRRFALESLTAEVGVASATKLPYPDASFDLVYSHGVIHHIPETESAIAEFYRVLRPGGTALVMLYHRGSFNYRVSIMLLRRLLVSLLLAPGATRAIAALTHEEPAVLEGHRTLLRRHGLRYLTDGALFLSNNTDGPGNPLSKVFSRGEAKQLFRAFTDLRLSVRFLNLRIYPGGRSFERTKLGRRLERRFGWHLYVEGRKPD
jgi:SAM-dependent methyltransferase